MKKLNYFLIIFLMCILYVPNVKADYVGQSNVSYYDCLAFADGYVKISNDRGQYDFKTCAAAVCSGGKISIGMLGNGSYKCENKNAMPYVTVKSDGCASSGTTCVQGQSDSYCTQVITIDCNRDNKGNPYNTPVSTTKTTTKKTTTTTEKITTKSPTKVPTKAPSTKATTTKATTTTKNPADSNVNLNYIEVIEKEVTDYSNDKNEYTIRVPYGVTDIKVEVEAEADTTNVEILGNTGVSDDEGKTITINIVAKDGTARTIVLNIERYSELSSTCGFKKLNIKEDSIKLKNNKYDYKVRVDEKVKKLTINYELLDDTTQVEIESNEELKDKSIIKIVNTAEDGTVCNYTITVRKGTSPVVIGLFVLLIAGVAAAATYFVLNNIKRSKGKYKYE